VELPAQPLNLESVSEPTRSTSAGLWHETSHCRTTLAGCPPWLHQYSAGPLNTKCSRGVQALRILAPSSSA